MRKFYCILIVTISFILQSYGDELGELLAFSKSALRENKVPMAMVALNEAEQIAPKDRQVLTILGQARSAMGLQKIRQTEYRIWLIRGALESHDKGYLYACRSMLRKLMELEPNNEKVINLYNKVQSEIENATRALPVAPMVKLPPKRVIETPPPVVSTFKPKATPKSPPPPIAPINTLPHVRTVKERPIIELPVIPAHPTASKVVEKKPEQAIANSESRFASLRKIDPKMDKVIEWRDNLSIDTVIEFDEHSLLKLGRRVYARGEQVSKYPVIYLKEIDAANNQILFVDDSGNEYLKAY